MEKSMPRTTSIACPPLSKRTDRFFTDRSGAAVMSENPSRHSASAIPSLRGSDPPQSTPFSQSIHMPCAPPTARPAGVVS